MPLSGADIDGAIEDRLKGDATLLGLVQGIWNTRAPDSLNVGAGTKPYILWQIVSADQDDAFQENTIEALVQVTYRDDWVNGLAPVTAVMHRVYGDSKAQAEMVPTFGLHRHLLTVADNEPGTMHRTRFFTQGDEKSYVYIEEYRVLLTEVA